MIDRIDDLEEMTIELLYWARDCHDENAARKMRAAAEMLTDVVRSLRQVGRSGAEASLGERSDALPLAAPCG